MLLLIIVCLASTAQAKRLVSPETRAIAALPGATVPVSSYNILKFESRLRPFLEGRASGGDAIARLSPHQTPRNSDLRQIARLWPNLSPQFKALYRQATRIPTSFLHYASPGGHFEVYYTDDTISADRVDLTDTYSYGSGGDWRIKVSQPNGIPDYIDEVAWACDSSWSMHVDRFGFVEPEPFTGSATPDGRYRIVIKSIGSRDYGLTYFHERTGAGKGFSSHIEIRNSWKGSQWRALGYEEHPHKGVRVTAAHELTHGIQYAMARHDTIDNFPLTWLEGMAVLMEGLAFNDIKDYLQYAGAFFDSDPGMSFFDGAQDMRIYSNSLLTKFIYEKSASVPDIGFLRTMTFANYTIPTPFHQNLRSTARSTGTPWVELLNRFHSGSHFTGGRADTARFIADAALLGQWGHTRDSLTDSYSATDSIRSYGMGVFSFVPQSSHADTLVIGIDCEVRSRDTAVAPLWAASCIIKRPSIPDSVAPVIFDDKGNTSLSIEHWRSCEEILVIVSNGHPSEKRAVRLSLVPCSGIAYHKGEHQDFFLAANHDQSHASIRFTANEDLRCDFSVRAEEDGPELPDNMVSIAGYFRLGYPSFWGVGATVSMTLDVHNSLIDHAEAANVLAQNSICVYRYADGSWTNAGGVRRKDLGENVWEVSPATPGTYAVLGICRSSLGAPRVAIYPNPARISGSRAMYFEADSIVSVRIYTAGGTLVCSSSDAYAFKAYAGGLQWPLVNNRRSAIVPGPYLAVVTRELAEGGKKTTLHKVMVFP